MTIMNGRFSIHHASRRCVLPNRVRPFTVEESATLLYTPQTQLEYSRKLFLQITIASLLAKERRLNSNVTFATAETLAPYSFAPRNQRAAGPVPEDRFGPRYTAPQLA
jgi:hypothetical protein